jgi:CRISPR/Cas system-associated protein Csm6
MRLPASAGILGLFLALTTNSANADDVRVVVKFKPGSTFATRQGSISGYDGVNYILDARAGQVISVLFSPNRASCAFNFYRPGAASAVHRGEIDGNEYADTLRRSGKNRVQVFQNRNAARRGVTCNYSITFEISG